MEFELVINAFNTKMFLKITLLSSFVNNLWSKSIMFYFTFNSEEELEYYSSIWALLGCVPSCWQIPNNISWDVFGFFIIIFFNRKSFVPDALPTHMYLVNAIVVTDFR